MEKENVGKNKTLATAIFDWKDIYDGKEGAKKKKYKRAFWINFYSAVNYHDNDICSTMS